MTTLNSTNGNGRYSSHGTDGGLTQSNRVNIERLYQLLPAIYRLRDVAEGEPLRALLATIEREYAVLEQDIERLYHNWFIETCDPWVVPYIGDLLDAVELYAENIHAYGQQERRGYVANTLAYRRRKGTAPILEQLTQDVTGWRSRAVEFARLVSATQSLQHRRPMSTNVNLRADEQQWIGTPFEQQASYSVSIRPTDQGGRYNASTIGLFIWRLQSYPIERGLARWVEKELPQFTPSPIERTSSPNANPDAEGRNEASRNGEARRSPLSGIEQSLCSIFSCEQERDEIRRIHYYTFNPLGYDMPLFNQPQTETTILTLAQELNVPAVLRSPVLMAERAERRAAAMKGGALQGLHYFDGDPVLHVFINGQREPLFPDEMIFESLSDDVLGNRQLGDRQLAERLTNDLPVSMVPPIVDQIPSPKVAIDPDLGRLVILDDEYFSKDNSAPPPKVEVSYFYGFSDDIGGGPYGRAWAVDLMPPTVVSSVEGGGAIAATKDEFDQIYMAPLTWIVQQGTTADPNPLATAIYMWNQTTTVWDGFAHNTLIPIGHVRVPSVTVAVASPEKMQRFQPGIVRGLEVSFGFNRTFLRVEAGLALDRDGQRLHLRQPISFQLRGDSIEALPEDEAGYSTGILVIAKQTVPSQSNEKPNEKSNGNGNGVLLDVVPETALEGYAAARFIPLRMVKFHRVEAILPPDIDQEGQENPGSAPAQTYPVTYRVMDIRDVPERYQLPDWSPGILDGFDIRVRPGTLDVWVAAGRVVDADGYTATLSQNYPIDVRDRQGTILTLVITRENQWIPQLVTDDAVTDLPEPYFILGTIDIPRIEVQPIPNAEGDRPSSTSAHHDHTYTEMLPPPAFELEGFGITPRGATVEIAPGTVTDHAGNTLTLSQKQTADLSRYAGRTVTLFFAGVPGQGFPLEFQDDPEEEGWEYFGVVPQQPRDFAQAHTGLIMIQDNGTYAGNLSITVPTGQTLTIIAGSGYRPHIQGSISIQGSALAKTVDQGELILDGLLIEGLVEVLPGNLKRLDIHHCTLASPGDSLKVHPAPPLAPPDGDDGISLIAFLIFCVTLIWQLNCQELGLASNTSTLTWKHAAFLISQQFQLLLERFEGVMNSYFECFTEPRHRGKPGLFTLTSNGRSPSPDSNFHRTHRDHYHDHDAGSTAPSGRNALGNARLAIHLYRTISGPVRLAETVPALLIEDSMIAKTTDPRQSLMTSTSALAIAAPGTAASIHTSTVFGRTEVRRLDANDSLFTEKITVQRRQVGCLRFCYVPPASRTPQRYQCQPDRVLRTNLNHIPAAITTLAQDHTQVFAGTAGDGIFVLTSSQESTQESTQETTQEISPENNDSNWMDISGDLGDRHITAILPGVQLYLDEANVVSATVTEGSQPYLLIGTDSGSLLRTPMTNTSASRPQGSSDVPGANAVIPWRLLPLPSNTAPISCIYQDDYRLPGTITIGSETAEGTPLRGTNTYFSREIRLNDYLSVDGRAAQVIRLGRPGGGTITSRNRTIRGTFSAALQPKDTITVHTPSGQLQTRTITAIIEGSNPSNAADNAEQRFRIDRPFDPPLRTAHGFVINQDTELLVTLAPPLGESSDGASDAATVNSQLMVHRLWVGTLGNGLWRGRMDGLHWEPFNDGLTSLAVTTWMRDRDDRLWIGTDGDGLFLFSPEEDEDGQQRDCWVPFNPGLTNGQIMALAETELEGGTSLWLGTKAGLFRYALPNRESTPGSGSEVDGAIALLQNPDPTQMWEPIVTPYITPESTITDLAVDQSGQALLVTMADGKVVLLTSLNQKKPRAVDSLDLQGTDVTTALMTPNGESIIGTAIGDVRRSQPISIPPSSSRSVTDPDSVTDPASTSEFIHSTSATDMKTWKSINDGLPDVAKTLELLNELQPSFTADQFGHPAYAQLSQACVPEIWTGAEDGAEMGVFNSLKQPQREANLRTSLDEYLRFGLEAGLFYVT